MKSFEKSTNKILLLASAFLIITVASFCFLFFNYTDGSKQSVSPNKPVIFFCGTKNSSSGDAQEGKQLFNSTCAACHKLEADMTGPALRNTDSILFRKWMYYEKSKIDSTKLDKLGIDYHLNLSKNSFEVSDLEKIYAYMGK